MNDRERNQAIKEAQNIAASEAYFEVRASVVNPQPHTIFDAGFSRGWDAGRAAIEAHEARKVPDGWKLVPIEPTKEMIDAYVRDPHRFFSARTDWAAMLASAPPAPQASAVKHEPVAAQHRFRHPQKTMPDWSPWQPCAVSNRRAWEIDSQGYEVEYRALYTRPAPVLEPLTDRVIAGALFDFMGWLTSRKERTVLSSCDDASPAVDAIQGFAKMRGLSLDHPMVEEWSAHGITKDTP